jgi:hypothetical protein
MTVRLDEDQALLIPKQLFLHMHTVGIGRDSEYRLNSSLNAIASSAIFQLPLLNAVIPGYEVAADRVYYRK